MLVVNRPENSFTIEHGGKMHRLKCGYGTYIMRKGRMAGLDWLVAGDFGGLMDKWLRRAQAWAPSPGIKLTS